MINQIRVSVFCSEAKVWQTRSELLLFLQLEYFTAQECLLKGERKWVMCFLLFPMEIFFLFKSSFERRKESGWCVFLFAILKFFIAQEFVLKGDRKWVIMCGVYLFAIGLFYCSKISFERRKKIGNVVFGVSSFAIDLFYCWRVFFEKREWVMLCLVFFCLQLNYFITQELCFERIWKG